MRKALGVFTGGLLFLLVALCWEYILNDSRETEWIRRFEQRLHEQEAEADKILENLRDSVGDACCGWEKDVIFAGFRKGKIFFWTDESIGMTGLYDRLKTGDKFIKINNAYYEIRKKEKRGEEYFALLHIKDSYPYYNNYVKNKFGAFLKIEAENADHISVSPFADGQEWEIRNREGEKLFYLQRSENFKDRSVNYMIICFYLFFFISLFYVYSLLLVSAVSFRRQLLYMLFFVVFLLILRYTMLLLHFPASLYRLTLFDETIIHGRTVNSVGDLMLSAFSIVQVLYISLTHLRVNYTSPRVRRCRYAIMFGLVTLAVVYIVFLNYTIGSLIEDTEVHLNIARVIHIGLPSMVAFVALIMGGLGLIIIIDGTIRIFRGLFSLKTALLGVTILIGPLIVAAALADLQITCWGWLFVWEEFLLFAVNRYIIKRDIQRTLHMLTIGLLAFYIVLISQKYEQYRELTQRAAYATELIEERDYNFEKKLSEINTQINDSEVIADLVANYNEEFLKLCLTDDLLDLNGYNYVSEITLCYKTDSMWVENMAKVYGCREYFGELIAAHCKPIEGTNFYAVNEFDGFVSYIGCFEFGDVVLYLRFDSVQDSEGSGYPQILSRKSEGGSHIIYPYSYAKYRNGQLVYSSGDFNYYRTFAAFREYNGNMSIVEKDNYSHLIIPVDEGGILVMSLHDNFFSLYYVNILYAFFVCILLSSYTLFFGKSQKINFRKGTLKTRIKNSIISLIAVLFIILTTLSIYLNTKSFENRHRTKATELMKYINKELEELHCVEYAECQGILEILRGMSEILKIDINIYSPSGMLVATSRPEIFSAGFAGYLIDPEALEHIVREGSMSFVKEKHIGQLDYMSVYMPLVLENGKSYVINVPYFTQNDELNLDIVIMVIIAVNIAIVVMVLAFVLSGIVAERVTKPLQMVNDKLKRMRIGGKNEKIAYARQDEIGSLVKEYNNMVEKLEESVNQLAKSERESAWREMARQIAHEIKNPLTPMKLNIQFMQRSLQIEDPEDFKKRFKDIAGVLIEQIDNMASIASAFSDFAKIPVSQKEVFDISEMVRNCVTLFEKNVDTLHCEIVQGLNVCADKEQIHRVIVNVLKNAVQSIPDDRKSEIAVRVNKAGQNVMIRIRDNGEGIPPEIQNRIFEPNFTTKTSGMGLGLAISRQIIESMGGIIDFRSLENGTEFFIQLEYKEIK